MSSYIYFTSTIGFCANLNNIIRAIAYCNDTNKRMYVCCDYGKHGDFSDFIDFDNQVEFISGIPPGYKLKTTDDCEICHPYWDVPNESLTNLDKLLRYEVPFETLRSIALRLKPKMDFEIPCKVYDAIHVRRGDALTSGEGCEYFHTMDYIRLTNCKDVFIMSDDVRVLDEITTLDKVIHHMIPAECLGHWGTPSYMTSRDQKCFLLQSREERHKLTERLVKEIYIASNSQKFLCTNSSVAVFIKLIHNDPTQCINLQETI